MARVRWESLSDTAACQTWTSLLSMSVTIWHLTRLTWPLLRHDGFNRTLGNVGHSRVCLEMKLKCIVEDWGKQTSSHANILFRFADTVYGRRPGKTKEESDTFSKSLRKHKRSQISQMVGFELMPNDRLSHVLSKHLMTRTSTFRKRMRPVQDLYGLRIARCMRCLKFHNWTDA